MVLAPSTGALGVVDAPKVDMAAVGQTHLAEHGVLDRRTPGTDLKARAISIRSGDRSASLVGANTPTLRPHSAASTASVINIVLLPHRRPHTRATRRWLRMISSASTCDGCSAASGRTTAPRGGSPSVTLTVAEMSSGRPPMTRGARSGGFVRALHPRAGREGGPALVWSPLDNALNRVPR